MKPRVTLRRALDDPSLLGASLGPAKASRRDRLNVAPYRDEIVLGQRQRNALSAVRPSPPITLSAANKPFAKTINLA